MLTVWGRTNSLNVQKVLWTLAELDLPFKRIEAGMHHGVNTTPEYLAMNPTGLIPTIDDGGFILWESNVIVRYLATRYGLGSLCPEPIDLRFIAEQWMDWQATALSPAMTPVFHGLIRQPPEKRDMKAIEAARERCETWLAVLDGHLATHDYVNGATFTMGDIPVGTSISRWFKLPVLRQPRPNVERWLGALSRRDGFQAHIDLPLS